MGKALNKYDFGPATEILIEPENMLYIPSRILAINHIFGGGIPYGRLVEIAGEFSSGKTLLTLDYIRSTIKLGGKACFIDAENSMTAAWLETNGIDTDAVDIFQEVEIETIGDFIRDWGIQARSELEANEPILVVLDSVAALDSAGKFSENQADAKAEMGSRAKAIYKMIRMINPIMAKLGISVILINQIRMKLGVLFGDNTTVPGGKAIEYFATIRAATYRGKKIEIRSNGKKTKIGNIVSLRVWKNKISPPVNPLKDIPVYFKETGEYNVGFGKYVGLVDILLELEVIEKSGNSYMFDGDRIAIGKDNVLEAIEEDSELRRDLLEAADINSISRTRKQMEEIEVNLYPLGKYENFL
jgi:recombination protein RecA